MRNDRSESRRSHLAAIQHRSGGPGGTNTTLRCCPKAFPPTRRQRPTRRRARSSSRKRDETHSRKSSPYSIQLCHRVLGARSARCDADYGVIHDIMHGATSIDWEAAGFVILAQEEVPGQDFTDTETHWSMVLPLHVKLRSSVAPPSPPNFTEAYGTPGALGNNGDLYLNLLNGDLYEQILGAWVLVGNVPQGGRPKCQA